LMKLVYDIIFGTRSCCDLLWTSNQTDFVFYMLMVVVLGIQFIVGVMYIFWYVYASSNNPTNNRIRRAYAENYRTITNVQMWGAWADKYYCSHPRSWNICNWVFSISVAVVWFMLSTFAVGFAAGLLGADLNAFHKGRISLTEPAMKLDVVLLVLTLLWYFRNFVFYAGQTVCMTEVCHDCKEKEKEKKEFARAAVDRHREEALKFLAPHKDKEGKDGKEGSEIGLSAASEDITEGALLLASLTASSACNPLTADSFAFCSAKAFRNKLEEERNPKPKQVMSDDDPESQLFASPRETLSGSYRG